MTFYYFYGGIAFSYFTFHFECFPQCTHTLQLHKEVYMSALCARKACTVSIHHPRASHVLLHSLAVVPTTHALSSVLSFVSVTVLFSNKGECLRLLSAMRSSALCRSRRILI